MRKAISIHFVSLLIFLIWNHWTCKGRCKYRNYCIIIITIVIMWGKSVSVVTAESLIFVKIVGWVFFRISISEDLTSWTWLCWTQEVDVGRMWQYWIVKRKQLRKKLFLRFDSKKMTGVRWRSLPNQIGWKVQNVNKICININWLTVSAVEPAVRGLKTLSFYCD